MKNIRKHIQTFEQHQNSDSENINKFWFNDREEWESERNKLNVSDDDENWSKDDKGELIAFWNTDRNEGWVKK